MSERRSQLNFATDATRGPPAPDDQDQERAPGSFRGSKEEKTSPKAGPTTQGVPSINRYTAID